MPLNEPEWTTEASDPAEVPTADISSDDAASTDPVVPGDVPGVGVDESLLTLVEQVCLDHIGSTLRDIGVSPADFPFVAAAIVANAWIRAAREDVTLGDALWDEALNLTAEF